MAKPVSILLVDDNPAFLRTATFFLEQSGEMIVVGAVTDGQEALDRVYDLDPDVVLLDLVMPGMTGGQIIARLRAEKPEIGIIAMSVWDIDSYRQAAIEAGADEFVSKAVISTELLPVIWRVLQVVQSRRKVASPTQATVEMVSGRSSTSE